MGVPGKSRWEWEYRTLSDYGVPGRRRIVSRHFSKQAAENGFRRLKKWYSRYSDLPERVTWRCWQEDRAGNIIADTGAVLYAPA